MRVLLVIVAVCVGLASCGTVQEEMDKYKASKESCSKEIPFNKEYFKEAIKGKVIDDPQFNCFLLCLGQGMGLVSGDGRVHKESIMKRIPSNLVAAVEPIVDKCSPLKGQNDCETAGIIFACVHENAMFRRLSASIK